MFSFRALPANSCDILIRMAKRKSTAQFTRSSATLRSTPARLGRLQPRQSDASFLAWPMGWFRFLTAST